MKKENNIQKIDDKEFMNEDQLNYYYHEQAKIKIEDSVKIMFSESINEHTYGVSDLAYNHNTKQLFSASFDNNINLIDIEKYTLDQKLKGHSDGVWTLDINEESNILASGSRDKSIKLWDTKSLKLNETIKFHSETVYDLKFNKKDKNLLLSCCKGKLAVWDLRNIKTPIYDVQEENNQFIYSCDFLSGNINYLVVSLLTGDLSIFDMNLKTNSKIKISSFHTNFSTYKSEENKETSNSVSFNEFRFMTFLW